MDPFSGVVMHVERDLSHTPNWLCTQDPTPERSPICVKTVGKCLCERDRDKLRSFVSHSRLAVHTRAKLEETI